MVISLQLRFYQEEILNQQSVYNILVMYNLFSNSHSQK